MGRNTAKKRRGNQYGGIYFSLQADKKEERCGERVCDKKRCTGKRRKAEFCGQAGVFIFDKVGIGRQLCLETGRASNQKRGPKLPAGKTVILQFLGTGMISVMPVPLLAARPRGCSPRGHIRYVPSVCVCRWTCRELLHRPP